MSLPGVFSVSVLGIPEQHKQTAETRQSTASDTAETQHEKAFFFLPKT